MNRILKFRSKPKQVPPAVKMMRDVDLPKVPVKSKCNFEFICIASDSYLTLSPYRAPYISSKDVNQRC